MLAKHTPYKALAWIPQTKPTKTASKWPIGLLFYGGKLTVSEALCEAAEAEGEETFQGGCPASKADPPPLEQAAASVAETGPKTEGGAGGGAAAAAAVEVGDDDGEEEAEEEAEVAGAGAGLDEEQWRSLGPPP